MIIRYLADTGEISGVFPADQWQDHVPEGHASVEVALDEHTARQVMAEPERFEGIVGMSVAELANDLDRLKAINREKIDEGGRERLKQVGLGTLDEATIASVGELYEIIRGQSGNVAMLDHLQQIRRRWNDLIEANGAAQTHAELEEVRWDAGS